MRQILIIHGGHSFSSYGAYLDALKTSQVIYERLKHSPDWKPWLTSGLTDSDVLLPSFPNKQNAKFDEWSIYFEKLIPFFRDDIQLVGHSLGAMFLAKYLQEKPLQQKVRRIILVAGGYDDTSGEDIGSFRVESATKLEESTREIHLFHSKDDPIVPYSEMAKFKTDLPEAVTHSFNDRLHFWQPEFPELLELLKQK